jgi:hypothetical protein
LGKSLTYNEPKAADKVSLMLIKATSSWM